MTFSKVYNVLIMLFVACCAFVAVGADDVATRIIAASLGLAIYLGQKLDKVVERLDSISVGKTPKE